MSWRLDDKGRNDQTPCLRQAGKHQTPNNYQIFNNQTIKHEIKKFGYLVIGD